LTQPLRSLDGVSAWAFDAYGTLFDFASAAARCGDVPAERRAALTSLWRDKQLRYTWLRTLEDRYADFWQVTGDALDFALESLDLKGPTSSRSPRFQRSSARCVRRHSKPPFFPTASPGPN
jgi:FMN phosphatase YigB (HAD superfamily)